MTDIAFHFNIAEPLSYLCRLLRKAHRAGAQVLVLADSEWLAELDKALWVSADAAEFLPHCLAAYASSTCLAATPIVLAATMQTSFGSASADVLVNLQHPVPTGFAQFSRLIEVVSLSEADKIAARNRWRWYASRGYALSRHDSGNDSRQDSRPEARSPSIV